MKANFVIIPLKRQVAINDVYQNMALIDKPYGFASESNQSGVGILHSENHKHLIPQQLIQISDEPVTNKTVGHVLWNNNIFTIGEHNTMKGDLSECKLVVAAYPELPNINVISKDLIKKFVGEPHAQIKTILLDRTLDEPFTDKSLKELATDFIERCHVFNSVSAMEGGIISLDDLLIDFVKKFYTKERIKSILEKYDEYIESHIDREAEATLCCGTPISNWDLDEWFEKFIKKEFH